MMPEVQSMLDVQTIAKWLNVTPRTVNRMIERGELPAYRVGGMYHIERSEMQAYLDAHRTQPKNRSNCSFALHYEAQDNVVELTK